MRLLPFCWFAADAAPCHVATYLVILHDQPLQLCGLSCLSKDNLKLEISCIVKISFAARVKGHIRGYCVPTLISSLCFLYIMGNILRNSQLKTGYSQSLRIRFSHKYYKQMHLNYCKILMRKILTMKLDLSNPSKFSPVKHLRHTVHTYIHTEEFVLFQNITFKWKRNSYIMQVPTM